MVEHQTDHIGMSKRLVDLWAQLARRDERTPAIVNGNGN